MMPCVCVAHRVHPVIDLEGAPFGIAATDRNPLPPASVDSVI